MRAVNPRSITNAERPWLEAWSLQTQKALLRALRDHGERNAVAFGVLGLITAKALGEPDGLSMGTRATYRKVLRDLAAAGVTPPPYRHVAPLDEVTAARARKAKTPGSGSGTAARATTTLVLLAGVALAAPRMPELSSWATDDDEEARIYGVSGNAWGVADTSLAA
jgi:hypothetical protein